LSAAFISFAQILDYIGCYDGLVQQLSGSAQKIRTESADNFKSKH